jgi:hypothetical protein
MFHKRGNIRNTSSIARAGARKKYGSALTNILDIFLYINPFDLLPS